MNDETDSEMVPLTRGEFWLLCQAVWSGVPIAVLDGDEQYLAETLNVEHHGLSHEQLIDTLFRMFDRKWIAVGALSASIVVRFPDTAV